MNVTFTFIMILFLLFAAFLAEFINIHSFFGAFVAGLCSPKSGHWHITTANHLELITKQLLLPLFFVSSGMKTNIGMLDLDLIRITLSVFLIASAAKLLPATLMTKIITKRNWKFSITVGILMNTRGLIELIALNIGYSMGILSQQIFTILVLMALLTSFTTAPLVYLIYQRLYIAELDRLSSHQLGSLSEIQEADLEEREGDEEIILKSHSEDEIRSSNRLDLTANINKDNHLKLNGNKNAYANHRIINVNDVTHHDENNLGEALITSSTSSSAEEEEKV